MSVDSLLRRHLTLIVGAAIVVPLVVCAVFVPFRDSVANTNVALVLVLLVVAAAATGIRAAGVAAALSSAAWFDFFLTEPYIQFTITDQADIETAVLLLLVGTAVTEVALWGRRQEARASRQQGYLEGVVKTATIAASGQAPIGSLIEQVASQIVDVLQIDACRFEPSTGSELPILDDDGTVVRDGRPVEVDRSGLPTNSEIALPIKSGGVVHGRFLLVASTRVARPSLEQRRVAVTLAHQVGAAMGPSASGGSTDSG